MQSVLDDWFLYVLEHYSLIGLFIIKLFNDLVFHFDFIKRIIIGLIVFPFGTFIIKVQTSEYYSFVL